MLYFKISSLMWERSLRRTFEPIKREGSTLGTHFSSIYCANNLGLKPRLLHLDKEIMVRKKPLKMSKGNQILNMSLMKKNMKMNLDMNLRVSPPLWTRLLNSYT